MTVETSTESQRKRRWSQRLMVTLSILIPLWLASSLAVGYCLTHRLTSARPEPLPPVTWAKLQPVRLTASDGIALGAWSADGDADRARPAVLILHGNGAGRSAMLGIGQVFSQHGHPILLLTLRAHGDSDGRINDFGRSAAADVIAAVQWIQAHWPGRPIVIYGESLGAAAAMFASEHLGQSINGYILVCPYRDLSSAVWNRTSIYLPSGLDLLAYAGLCIASPLVLPDAMSISPSNALARAPETVPILLLAGQQDLQAPVDQVNDIHRRVASHAILQILPGKHLQLRAAQPETFDRVITDFAEHPSATTVPSGSSGLWRLGGFRD